MSHPDVDLSRAIEPDSDRINGDDLLLGPRTITITDVILGKDEKGKATFFLVTQEFGPDRPFKPNVNMRRVILKVWGTKRSQSIGKKMVIYRDPDVKLGREIVGGVRISHMSHIDGPKQVDITPTRGKHAIWTVQPLAADV